MTRNAKPRKAYRPGPVHANATHMALTGVRKIAAHDVRNQIKLINSALQQFMAGIHCAAHWRSLADAANMAETLAAMHICGGQQANELIDAAQRALAAVHSRQQITASWTLYASEIEALGWLTTLHARQLAECDYSEFERALQRTHNRVSAARAGNAPRGAIVVIGDMA